MQRSLYARSAPRAVRWMVCASELWGWSARGAALAQEACCAVMGRATPGPRRRWDWKRREQHCRREHHWMPTTPPLLLPPLLLLSVCMARSQCWRRVELQRSRIGASEGAAYTHALAAEPRVSAALLVLPRPEEQRAVVAQEPASSDSDVQAGAAAAAAAAVLASVNQRADCRAGVETSHRRAQCELWAGTSMASFRQVKSAASSV